MHKTKLAKVGVIETTLHLSLAFKRNKTERYDPSLMPIYIGPPVVGIPHVVTIFL